MAAVHQLNYLLILSVILTFHCFSKVVSQNQPISNEIPGSEANTKVTKPGFLVNHPACQKDLRALAVMCGLSKIDMENDFATLSCAQNRPPDKFEAVSETCEQVLWNFKMNLTKSKMFLEQIEKACARDTDRLTGCKNSYPTNLDAGHYMSCLIDQKLEGGLKPSCEDFLTQIESVIFSDYRLIADFTDKCKADIEGNTCGHVRRQLHSDSNMIFYHHSQGLVIECLSKFVDQVNASCREEILHVAELQSDDYHLDRTLYFACKADKELLCPQMRAGNGRIFDCLLSHKEDPTMSDGCKSQLRRRQKLASENYKVNRGLAKACKEEIKTNKCRKQKMKPKPVRLAEILLCLEEKMRNEDAIIGGPCQSEMKAHRHMLMEDYAVSPELVAKCGSDITKSCQKEVQKGHGPGETIHCLLRLAAEHKLEEPSCEDELKVLLKEVDVASDWQVDPVLQKTCQDVVTAACDPASSATGIMSCLMTQVATHSRHMTQECKATLMEIQYFLARDYALDPKLYQKCREDASHLCQAEEHWYSQLDNKDGNPSQFVFPCLVRYLYGDGEEEDGENGQQLSDQCADEVERVLEQRAISVNLHPEIEDACRGELTTKCGPATGDGEELKCLQDNLNSLGPECSNAVRTYTEMEAKNAVLNPVIAAACHGIIDQHCQEEVSHKDEGTVIQCLIKFRDDHEADGGMDDKCSAAVEHWQILSMNDYKFSFKFKDACKHDIRKECAKFEPKTKADVVGCLSTIARDDVIQDRNPKTLSKQCRVQLKFQLLQKHSNIKLNDKIATMCKKAIKNYCPIGHGNILECLKELDHNKMSTQCREAVFVEEHEEVLFDVDHELIIGCKHEIKRHCQSIEQVNGLLNCLKEVKNDANFDRSCKMIVNRRIIQHTRDYRLRPRLQKACELDLKKFCGDVLLNAHRETTKDFLEGQVIQCLQDKVVQDPDSLSDSCKEEMQITIRDEALDYRANPILLTECPSTIKSCEAELAQDQPDTRTTDYGSKIEECLRDKFKKGDVPDGRLCSKAIAKLIEAANIDIQADPLLHRACAVDVSKFCRDVLHGSGQQLQCLANVIRDSSLRLEPKCDSLLRVRLEMFDMALKIVPINGIHDLWIQVSSSPHKNYFLLLVFTFFSMIFIGGLICGRVTKSIRRDLKDR